ncbi:hypothetical protein FRB93_008819 [Tulasnella sp. JGI-2019a]|nr:hypothetical protein FRB93_008819 [Tulasnella sp. JGI-2019a]
MDGSSPSLKRARTEADDFSLYKKDLEYYFPDGAICLAATHILFRIHNDVLIRHSSVFRNALRLPGDGIDKTFEGVPILKLDDEAEDLRVLFKLAYNSPPVDVSFHVIGRAARITDKYDFQEFQSWAISFLKRYPSTETPVDHHTRIRPGKQFLNRRDLDAHAALASYALLVVDLEAHNQGAILQGLSVATINRLSRGKAVIYKMFAEEISEFLGHRCSSVNKVNSAQAESVQRACEWEMYIVLDVPLPQLNGDAILVLNKAIPSESHRICKKLRVGLGNLVKLAFRQIPAAYGFEAVV